MMKKLVLSLGLVLSVLIFVACTADEAAGDEVFYIGGIPDQNKNDLDNAMNELAEILSEATGIDVRYREVADYAAVVSGFSRNEIHLAWFGGLTGVQGRELLEDSVAVVQRLEDTGFTSVIIAGADTGIERLEDMKGHSFTFGSESSTSGHLMPRYFLAQSGIDPENDFIGEVGYSGSHDRTIELVSNGAFDAGALNDIVWNRYVEEGLVDYDKVQLIEHTSEYYNYNFSMPSQAYVDSTFGEGIFDTIVDTLLDVDIENNPALYAFFVSRGFIPTTNENYDDIRTIAEMLGLFIEQ